MRRSYRALNASNAHAGQKIVQALHAIEKFISGGREALAQGGYLGSDVVRTSCHWQVCVLRGQRCQTGQRRDALHSQQLQCLP